MDKHIGVKRFRGALPTIGIRPTIDGRMQGVREALEDQTMNLAKYIAEFLLNNIKHPNGLRVKCVVSDTTIGGVAEAAECAELFRRENVGLSITVTPSWCYGTETMEMDPFIPKAIYGFNGTERPGAVYLAAVLAGHAQKGLPAFGIYGHEVQDINDLSIPDDIQEKLLRFARAGLTVAWMRGKSYLSMGNVSMGIAGSIIDETFFQDYLGMRNEYVDMSEFIRRINNNIFDTEEFERAKNWVKENCIEGKDVNPPEEQFSREEKDKNWETVIKMAMIARDLMVGNRKLTKMGYSEEALGRNAIAAGFQGQRQWTDFMPNGDFLECILNSSFDWNGIRQPYIVATENDSLNGIAMLFGHLLTGTAQIFADVRTYWSPEAIKRITNMDLPETANDGVIHLINSGPAALDGTGQQILDGNPALKPFWDISEEEVKNCLEATTFPPVVSVYFRGGGYSTCFLTKGGMPVTMSRISLVKGLGPILQIAEGNTVELPKVMHTILDERTNETWPTTWFVPRLTGKGAFKSVYDVMNNWSANHGSICFGHIGADLITLAGMLRIPVAMHNVPEEKIYRPNDWKLFGTLDLEGADYRACKNFGPLYGMK
jgi:L-fucose isomerase